MLSSQSLHYLMNAIQMYFLFLILKFHLSLSKVYKISIVAYLSILGKSSEMNLWLFVGTHVAFLAVIVL